MYYAIEKPYGVDTINHNGSQADKVHRFESQAKRDDYVSRDPAHRAAIGAACAEVRRAKNWARDMRDHGVSWPIKI